jgi:cytosine/adenosine deaminase-related metal-dependent hydrolase
VLTPTPADARRPLSNSQLELLHPAVRDRYLRLRQNASPSGNTTSQAPEGPMVPRLLVAFVKAGGLLVLGTDAGCCRYDHFAGRANHEALIRLASFRFSLEAIRIATLNGVGFLGIANRTGSIEVGKEADLLIVRGDPSVRIEDIEQVELVFSNGLQYRPQELLSQVKGMVGWR